VDTTDSASRVQGPDRDEPDKTVGDLVEDLLSLALNAHGGLDRWQSVQRLEAVVTADGPFFTWRAVDPAMLTRFTVDIELHTERVTLRPWGKNGGNFTLSVNPEVATITSAGGGVEERRADPRSSFPTTGRETPWDDIQIGYFLGYALWNYLTTPFLLTYPGVRAHEIEPWNEEEHTWRRLQVDFPPTIATHSARQAFYFEDHGALQRMDYNVEISQNGPAAHYVDDYKKVGAFWFPTARFVARRNDDNTVNRSFSGARGSFIHLTLHEISIS
jgi:hypothetical protein